MGCGLGADFKSAIGFAGILISGRQPIGGGSNDFGDFLLFPFVCGVDSCWLLFLTAGPVGKTWNGIPIASEPIDGGGGGGGIDPDCGVCGVCGAVWTAGELFPLELFCANGETFGCTPGLLAFAEIPVDQTLYYSYSV